MMVVNSCSHDVNKDPSGNIHDGGDGRVDVKTGVVLVAEVAMQVCVMMVGMLVVMVVVSNIVGINAGGWLVAESVIN